MRIHEARYGCDTGMYLVDVVLESAEEMSLDEPAIWQVLRPKFEERGIHPADVVDIFLHTIDERGELRSWRRC